MIAANLATREQYNLVMQTQSKKIFTTTERFLPRSSYKFRFFHVNRNTPLCAPFGPLTPVIISCDRPAFHSGGLKTWGQDRK